MNKYKKLIFNTFIFGIGTFSSKLLVFLLMPVYTHMLSQGEYSTVDLLQQTGNLLIPLAMMGMSNAVIRFGLDRSVRKSEVFTTGLSCILFGFGFLLLFAPLLSLLSFVNGYTVYLYLFMLMSALRSLCSTFVRAKQYVRLYAFDGFLSTLLTLTFTILFLVVFKWGVAGYLLAIICADFLSAIFLFFIAHLSRYLDFKHFNKQTAKAMLKYSLPMIPANIFWWITNVSDRYMVAYMVSSEANGLFAVSYKIPSIVMLISGIFMEAWQLSAVTEDDKRTRGTFFTRVFSCYSSLVLLTASGLIAFCRLIMKIMVAQSFYEAWRFIPVLVIATSFSCFVSFLGSVYVVEKRSGLTFATTLLGAAADVALNFLLIPKWGAQGGAVATCVSYLIVFVVRAINTRQFVPLQFGLPKLLLNLMILVGQTLILLFEVPLWALWQALLVLVMLLINGPMLLSSVLELMHKRRPKKLEN